MERFSWFERDERDLSQRFPESVNGFPAWRDLVARVREHAAEPDNDWGREFDLFLGQVAQTPLPPARTRACCVFISHRRADTGESLRVAWLADQAGFDYWLDIHDPALVLATNAPLPAQAKAVLMAAIIEMALLNVTHVIALQTNNSAGSLWIPYELARAKVRLPVSDQAACWFKNGTAPASCGEYVHLVLSTFQETDIDGWLTAGLSTCAGPAVSGWTRPVPNVLDCWPPGTRF